MRQILHVDMDAFYAAVEQFDHPEFKGRPVIVGADPKDGTGRGVVAACSYEARGFGIHSALPISQAWRLCPGAVYLRPRFDRYKEVSGTIMEIFRRYTDLVEPLTNKYPDNFNFTLDPEAKKRLPYEDGQFDAVLSVGVLEHVRETGGEELASLEEINRVLTEGGVFICYHLPNRYSWIDFFVRMISNRLHRHDYRYTRKDIKQMLSSAEFELQQCQRYGFLPRLPSRSLPRRIAMSKSLATSYSALDRVLSKALSWFDQNYYFVAVKQ